MDDSVYLVVKSIDLITEEELIRLPENIRDTCTIWSWTLTSRSNKVIVDVGIPLGTMLVLPTSDNIAVRPALLIEGLDSLNLPLYTELEIFDKEWIYIGNDKALVKIYLWEGHFDKKSSEYKTSEIKLKLDAWLQKLKARFDKD